MFQSAEISRAGISSYTTLTDKLWICLLNLTGGNWQK